MKKKVVPKLRQEVKVKIDIVTSDDIKICYTGKFQDFTARYIIKENNPLALTKFFLARTSGRVDSFDSACGCQHYSCLIFG